MTPPDRRRRTNNQNPNAVWLYVGADIVRHLDVGLPEELQ
jgi:hypothetical protein